MTVLAKPAAVNWKWEKCGSETKLWGELSCETEKYESLSHMVPNQVWLFWRGQQQFTRERNTVMNPTEPGTKNDCDGKG